MIDEDKFKAMASQRKFCMAPWVHTYVYPDGRVSPCCQARSENITLDSELTPYNCGSLHENSLSEIWNSENYKKIRNDLITQGYSKVCKECYKNEKLGHYSMRNLFNEKFFHHAEKIKETKDDGTFEEVNIVYGDFRLSNTCNFKCRMCSPLLSSSWESEIEKNKKTFENFFDEFETSLDMNTLDSEKFLKDNEFLFDIVEEVYFAGGEPLLMDIHYKILKRLIQLKKYHIPISYNTNFSTLKYKNINVLDLWAVFPNLFVGISIEGYGDRGKLIRNGFIWDKFIQNFHEFKKKFPRNNPHITPTVQVLNCLHICDLQKKLFELKIINNLEQFDFGLLHSPSYLSVLILTNSLKEQVRKKVDDHIENFLIPNKVSKTHLQLWNSYKEFISSEDHQYKIPQFLKYTEELDKIRNENTKETFPELIELWK